MMEINVIITLPATRALTRKSEDDTGAVQPDMDAELATMRADILTLTYSVMRNAQTMRDMANKIEYGVIGKIDPDKLSREQMSAVLEELKPIADLVAEATGLMTRAAS